VTVLHVPYHLDEYLPDLDLVLRADAVVAADLPSGDTWARLAAVYRLVAGAVSDGTCPVVVSGDCPTALGTVAGLQRAGIDAGIVWFDAHGDVQTLETTASGYLGGLPLRLLVGYRPEVIAIRLGLRPVPEHRVTLVGARDLDPPEVAYLAHAPIGRREVTAMDAAALPGGPLYVHVDLDVIDPAEGTRPAVPGVRRPANRGRRRSASHGPGDWPGRRGRYRLHLASGHRAAEGISPHLAEALATGD
jgi:arginase